MPIRIKKISNLCFNKKIIFLLLFLIMIYFIFTKNDFTYKELKQDASPIVVEVIKPKSSYSIEQINLIGESASSKVIEIKAISEGYIQKMNFSTGDLVSKGNLLVEMDNEFIDKQIEIEKQINAINKKKSEAIDGLLKRKVISYFEYSKNKLDFLNHEKIYNDLLNTKSKRLIFSPIDGVIETTLISEKTYVFPQDKIAVMHDIDPIKISFNINEDDYYKMKMSDQSRIEGYIQALDKKVYIKDIRSSEISKDRSHTLEIETLMSNEDKKIKPGMFVKVKIIFLNTHNAVSLVPKQAIFSNDDNQYYLYLNRNNIAKKIFLPIEKIDSDFLETKYIFQPNDEIIIASSTKLYNGAKIVKEGN